MFEQGKIARVLAGKCALAIRVDALGDVEVEERKKEEIIIFYLIFSFLPFLQTAEVGEQGRARVEQRLRMLENRSNSTFVKSAGMEKKRKNFEIFFF